MAIIKDEGKKRDRKKGRNLFENPIFEGKGRKSLKQAVGLAVDWKNGLIVIGDWLQSHYV